MASEQGLVLKYLNTKHVFAHCQKMAACIAKNGYSHEVTHVITVALLLPFAKSW